MIYGYIESKLDGSEKKFSKTTIIPKQFKYNMPPVLDQGQLPICVPCAISAFLNWDINLKDGKSDRDNNIDLMAIFKGGNGCAQGMEIKKALQYLKGQNQITSYATIGSPLVLKSAILLNGPCVGGLMVRDDNKVNFWEGNSNLGGHCISIIGWDEDNFLIRNSWGSETLARLNDFSQFLELWTIIN